MSATHKENQMSLDVPTSTPASNEPLLSENKDRFVIFPIQHSDIWNFYKKHEASFWTAEEIDLSPDQVDWATKLNDDESQYYQVLRRGVAAFTKGVAPLIAVPLRFQI